MHAAMIKQASHIRVLTIDDLFVPGALDYLGGIDAKRRLSTLLSIDTSENKTGGTGKATKVYNCLGEPICLKSLKPVQRIHMSESERQRLLTIRAQALEDEFSCQTNLAGIPGIPRTFGFGTYAGGPVMLMEWVQGVSLRNSLLPFASHDGGIGAVECATVGAIVAGTLCAARTRDPLFVHRDLSGHNILLRTDNLNIRRQLESCHFDICLIDYGSAISSPVMRRITMAMRETPRIWHNATPEYAPPEMLTHNDETLVPLRRSELIDVYALCSVIYELYSGHTPYRLTERHPHHASRYKLEHPPDDVVPHRSSDAVFLDLLSEGLCGRQDARVGLKELHERMLQICQTKRPALADRLQEQYEIAVAAAHVQR